MIDDSDRGEKSIIEDTGEIILSSFNIVKPIFGLAYLWLCSNHFSEYPCILSIFFHVSPNRGQPPSVSHLLSRSVVQGKRDD